MSGPVLIAAGGTGGHVFPALALVDALAQRGHEAVMVCDRRGADLVDRAAALTPLRARYIVPAATVRGGPLRALAGLWRLMEGITAARRLVREIAPSVAIGFGGYPSVPPMLAAAGAGVPIILHEQNARLGRANRRLLHRADAVALTFAATSGMTAQERARAHVVGNPVRAAVARLADAPYPLRAVDMPFNLLVLGGSQGARVFSEVLPAAVERLSDSHRARLGIVAQARPEDVDRTRLRLFNLGVEATLETFFADVPGLLADAHLVIARAGASTVAELIAAGRPAILVPYPHAADDHQTVNARLIAAARGGWLAPQADFTADWLAARLARLIDRPSELMDAAAAIATAGPRDAADRLADLVENLLAGVDAARPAAPAGGDANRALREARA